jgi:hypothetical protein
MTEKRSIRWRSFAFGILPFIISLIIIGIWITSIGCDEEIGWASFQPERGVYNEMGIYAYNGIVRLGGFSENWAPNLGPPLSSRSGFFWHNFLGNSRSTVIPEGPFWNRLGFSLTPTYSDTDGYRFTTWGARMPAWFPVLLFGVPPVLWKVRRRLRHYMRPQLA